MKKAGSVWTSFIISTDLIWKEALVTLNIYNLHKISKQQEVFKKGYC